jgi:hypothetical protein
MSAPELDKGALAIAEAAYMAAGDDEDGLRVFLAAYLAALRPAEPVAVKALAWNDGIELPSGQTVWSALAEGSGTTYSIWSCPNEDAVAPFVSTNFHNGFFNSLEEGKIACQADYEQRIRSALVAHPGETFQKRVQPWMMACFGAEISADRIERGDRLLEEVFELLQSGDYPRERVRALEDYSWSRPKGEPSQEVGGVMVTLAAYCLAHELDMHEAGETELARIWTKVEKIRAKQAAKPKHSPLPVAHPGETAEPVLEEIAAERRRQIEVEGYDARHDDQPHVAKRLCHAAAAYIFGRTKFETYLTRPGEPTERVVTRLWPWADDTFKPGDHRRNLIKAGALILAEIERMDRRLTKEGGE